MAVIIAYGVGEARDIFGTVSEISGPGIAFECPYQAGLHIWEDYVYPEIVDPKTFDGVFDYDYLATIFEENHDCNIADNVQWLEIIETYIRENDIILEP